MTASVWLIGSYRELPIQLFSINAGAGVISAGSRYLYHDTAGLSLLTALQTAMTSAGVGAASAVLLRNRKVRLSGNADFTITWPADNVLRNLLGFTGNLAGASTYTAPLISRLLWSPGRCEWSTAAPGGVLGHPLHNVYFAQSPLDNNLSAVGHGPPRYVNAFKFPHVAAARYQTASNLGGEWSAFFDQVCIKAASFHLWRNVDESDASSSPVTLSTRIGPYVLQPQRRSLDWTFARSTGGNFSLTDTRYEHQIAVSVVPEYAT